MYFSTSLSSQAILEDYWKRGMVSSKPGTTGGNLVEEVMRKTGLKKKRVQVFIPYCDTQKTKTADDQIAETQVNI